MNPANPKIQAKSIQRIQNGIQITWLDQHVSEYSAELLRRRCPCAVCKETPGRENNLLPAHLISPSIDVLNAKPIGWYALQFSFSDQHDTGIYSFEWLREICPCEKCKPNP